MTASDKSADQLKNVLLCRGYPHMSLVLHASNGRFQPFLDIRLRASTMRQAMQEGRIVCIRWKCSDSVLGRRKQPFTDLST